MWATWRMGAGAAAVLPAALAGAVLVSAPFAGTTTAPLAQTNSASGSADAASAPVCVVISRADTC